MKKTEELRRQTPYMNSSGSIWNLANILTLVRVALVPVCFVSYQHERYIAALAVFLTAAFTDWLDGYVARKYHIVTRFGTVIDPLADKLISAMMLICLASSGWADSAVVTFVLVMEALMLTGGALLIKRGVAISSRPVGKIAQCLMISAISLSFFHNFFISWIIPLDVIVLWGAMTMTFLSIVVYVSQIIKPIISENKKASA